ncbi:hypothetical protein [Olsenella sp. Marseille-QA0557]
MRAPNTYGCMTAQHDAVVTPPGRNLKHAVGANDCAVEVSSKALLIDNS